MKAKVGIKNNSFHSVLSVWFRYLALALFLVGFTSSALAATFDFDNPAVTGNSTATVQQGPVSGVTMTATIDYGTWLVTAGGGWGGTTNNVMVDQVTHTLETFSFSSAIDLTSIQLGSQGNAQNLVLTPTGGSGNSAVTLTTTVGSAPVITLNWTGITSFTVTENGGDGIFSDVLYDNFIFIPGTSPIATTGVATAISATGATLNGTVDDNGATTTVSFDYGTTVAYGTNVAATTNGTITAGSGIQSVAVSLTTLACNTTYHSRVKAVNSGGTTYGNDASFTTTTCAPTVTGISPTSGPTAGGTSVTITGTDFTGATSVTIGGAAATSVVVANSTTITATTPAGTVGAQNVAVTTPGGTGTGTGLFTYVAAPTVTGISPSYGITTGGTSVTITGTNLIGATSVTIGGAAATGVTVVNSTTITATTPAGTTGAKNVAVTTIGGTGTGTSLFTYIAAPTVSGISPSAGPTAGGTSVTITGTSFTGATSVTVGGAAATGVTVVNDTTITATTPAGTAGARDVVVTNTVGSGTGTGLFTYVAAPTVTGISPSSGPSAGGTSVTITGTNFTGATSVTIGGAAATSVVVVNSTTITATTPAGSVGARDVAVTTTGGTGTGTGLFTYIASPTVTGISPTGGPIAGGTSVTITGTNLTGATSVTIGGSAATSVTVVNSTTITATTPSGTAGAKDVVVTTPGGTGTGTSLYTYYATPTVSGISPSSGSTAGGTSVTITGTNLGGATSVTIGGAAATGVTVVNATTITATTPSGTAGARDVVVTTPGGSGTGTGLFTYVVAPTVTGISPSYGTTTGGTSVTITGTNFTGATSVTIGGAAATSVVVVNPTTITATTPAGSAGARDIAVTTTGGTGTGTGLFTYVTTPTVTGISPSSGLTAGGTSVTITGTSFTGATSVTIGGAAATNVTVVNNTTITATTPAGTAGAQDVVVTNTVGSGTGAGLFTYSTATAPDAPTGVTVTAGDGQATVNFTAPASDGGSPITSYTATSSSGGLTGTCAGPAACEITVTGLTNGTAYTFTVIATNATGDSAASAASNTVTPAAARPDPTQDPDVIGVVDDQVETAGRFWRTQLSNYQQRLESIHHAVRTNPSPAKKLTPGNGLALSSDSESFAGASVAQHNSGRILFARSGDSQPDSISVGSSDQITMAVVTELASILTTESLNLNMASLDNNAGSEAGASDELDIWAAGNVRIGKRETQDGSAMIDYTTDGITIGADRRYSENLMLGMGIGYAHDESTIGSDGTGSISNGTSIALYGSYQPGTSLFIDGLVGYGVLTLDSDRYVSSVSAIAQASRPGSQVFGSLAVGYEYLDDNTLMSPYARYDIAVDWLESATETGAGSSSLNYASQDYTSQQMSLGLRADFRYKGDSYTMQPRARVEYQHRIDGGSQASIAYADLLASRYTMSVPTVNSNSILIGVGSSFALRSGLTLDLDYQWVHATENDESQAIFVRISKMLRGD